MEYTRTPLRERCGVAIRVDTLASGLDADEFHRRILRERIEESDRVAAAADAGDRVVGQAPLRLEDLRTRLAADDALEVADEHGIRVRSGRAADEVVGVADVRHPAANGLVHRVLEGARAAL